MILISEGKKVNSDKKQTPPQKKPQNTCDQSRVVKMETILKNAGRTG